jgi:hypothetical protein
MTSTAQGDARTTYRQLRVAMPLLVLLLAAAVLHQIFKPEPDCWLGSISAYYYTPARAVFVAALCSIGICLIVYRGSSPREDAVLNLPGVLAFVVAFIPTPLKDLTVEPDSCRHSNVPTETQLATALDNNIFALLVGLTGALVVVIAFRALHVSSASAIPTYGFAVFVAAGWVWFLAAPANLRQHGHFVAAILLFLGIVAVTVMQAFHTRWLDPKTQPAREPYRGIYRAILAVMIVGFVVIGGLAVFASFDHTVFWLESLIIVMFAAFWITQTVELWHETD